MKFRRLIVFSFAVISIAFLYACFTSSRVSQQNIADLYRSDYHYLHPEFHIYHAHDSSALIYYRLNEAELLYIRKIPQDSFYATVKIFCKATQDYESGDIIDSGSVVLKFSSVANTKKAFAVGSIPLKLKINQGYLVTITTTDLISKKEDIAFISAPNTQGLGDQNFLVTNSDNGQPLLTNYTDTETNLAITYNKPAPKLTVNYYNRIFPLAAPPFSINDQKPFKYKPDSSFVITAGPDNQFHFKVGSKGFYHIQADTASHYGLTIYRHERYFPNIGEAGQMVPPLRYITSTEEYDRLNTSKNVKQAVDEFWLNVASSPDRAKSLIRIYYNRVEDANKFFTSYIDGWKTDRGMIYLIYGPPVVVYRNSTSETWTYGEDRNFMSLSFTFEKTDNPFTNNDFVLDRSPLFRNLWYNTVDTWRQGRVY
jgi:GWxTD domain-containing protein